MSLGRGTHWKGPLLGADNAGGGLFEDFPTQIMGSNEVQYWVTSFLDHTLAQYWTQTNIVGGTAAITQETANPLLSLTHGTADQGPSLRWLGTDGRGNTIGPISATNSVTVFETRAIHQTNLGTNDAFIGFIGNGTASPAAHPLAADGTLNVASILDGFGFHWLAANGGRPIMVAWRNGVAETLASPPTLATDVLAVGRYFGARCEVGSSNTNTNISYYVNRRLVFRHKMSAAFTQRATFAVGLVSNVAGAQFNLDRLAIGRNLTTTTPPE